MPEPGAGSGGARGGSGMGAGDRGGNGRDSERDSFGREADRIGYRVGPDRGDLVGIDISPRPSLIQNYLEDYTVPKVAPVARPAPKPVEHEAKKHAPRVNPVSAPTQPVSPAPVSTRSVDTSSGTGMTKVGLNLRDPAKEKEKADAVRTGSAGSDMQNYGDWSSVLSTLTDMVGNQPVYDSSVVTDNPTRAVKDHWQGKPTMPNFMSGLPIETQLQIMGTNMPTIDWADYNKVGPTKVGWTDTKPMAIWERPLSTQQLGYIDPSTYSSVMGGPGQKNSTYGQIREALEKAYQLQKSPSNIENYVGPGQKDALDTLPAFDKNKHRLAQLEEEAIKNSGFFRQWNPYSDYSKTGNIYNRSILEANMLADKYANMYGLPKNKQEASMNTYEMSSGVPGQTLPPHANRYTMYDLARHAFLASQTGLIPAQLTENVGSSGQPSDYINNILANKFMRPGGTMTKNLSSLLGTSQIPNKNQKMNEWMQLVYKEMTNPGSTGYNFNFDIYD